MITLHDYFMGRDKAYPGEQTPEIIRSAQVLLGRANTMLTFFYIDYPYAPRHKVSSGWRPAAINKKTPGAAPHSRHITAQAVDIEDTDRLLAHWCAVNERLLERYVLWMERPESTPTWVHWQSVPPPSGTRFFWPNDEARRAFLASNQQPIVVS